MRRTDEPLDPDVVAELDAIEAVLAGDPVDPQYAELAELALLVAGEKPAVDPGFAARLDERVGRRFGPDSAASPPSPRVRRRWLGWTLGLAGSASAAAIAVVVVVGGGGGGAHGGRVSSTAASSGGVAPARSAARRAPTANLAPLTTLDSSASSRAGANSGVRSAAGSGSAPSLSLRPPANGRKTIQSANLALSTAPGHIDAVAQELFDVVGRENGIVNNSTVTAASQGYAQFELSIPSSNLPDTMTALSQLRYARVDSRTDTTQDVNGQYVSANRRLADDRALRTSLLKRLANATTQTEIDSLKAQIHDAENAIARDEAAIRSLNRRINYSRIEVTVNSAAMLAPQHHSGGGFTLGKAAHDAGRVLTVVAGVALIALAALLPLLLAGSLIWWIGAALRRRRREQALDMA